ncbi:DinB family protein [Aquipuribacter hungaricus]|uniref:DinB family protein n=1 Tax=Aquipuribacter hungaricus TaxID=545624 RepID=A0ABV7WB76_9MICO
MTTSEPTTAQETDRERADLLESLRAHRAFLRHTVQGLTDEQARLRPVPSSELSLGGLVKHVLLTERQWVDFVLDGPAVMAATHESWAERADGFVLRRDEKLEGVLAAYAEVARRTDELVLSLPDLDAAQPLPEAPWFETGATRSARRVLVHIVGETAQHAGHADILREAVDGQKTMG